LLFFIPIHRPVYLDNPVVMPKLISPEIRLDRPTIAETVPTTLPPAILEMINQ
jgi:hypothetical protein